MLLPQANKVRPSTVLLRLSATPSMCSRLTTSEAAALINTALTTKPNRANSCRGKKTNVDFNATWKMCINPIRQQNIFWSSD